MGLGACDGFFPVLAESENSMLSATYRHSLPPNVSICPLKRSLERRLELPPFAEPVGPSLRVLSGLPVNRGTAFTGINGAESPLRGHCLAAVTCPWPPCHEPFQVEPLTFSVESCALGCDSLQTQRARHPVEFCRHPFHLAQSVCPRISPASTSRTQVKNSATCGQSSDGDADEQPRNAFLFRQAARRPAPGRALV